MDGFLDMNSVLSGYAAIGLNGDVTWHKCKILYCPKLPQKVSKMLRKD
jgi:hypothetical protein